MTGRETDTMIRVLLALVWLLSSQIVNGETSYRYIPVDTIRVTSVILEPYLMTNPIYTEGSGLPQYIGYIPDLLAELAKVNSMDYVITPREDSQFGHKSKSDGSWDGMIGQLARQEADIAAAPMYRTDQRARVVDFTFPFITVEATLLLRKQPPGTELQIRSIEDLVTQSEIAYGTLDRGVIVHAFKNTNSSLLARMWRQIERMETFTATNEEGIARVREEKFGFVLPHPIGEYMSMQEPCDLITVDRFLMRRGYSLAVGKGSDLLQKLDRAMKVLEKNGKLADLYRTWWLERSICRGSGSSGEIHSSRLALAGGGSRVRSSGVLLCVLLVLSSWWSS